MVQSLSPVGGSAVSLFSDIRIASQRDQTVSKSLMSLKVGPAPLAASPDLLTDLARLANLQTS